MTVSPLLYLGTALFVGSAICGIAAGIIHIGRAKVEDFKYGEFYSVFALVGSVGFCLAMIAWYFNFLKPGPVTYFLSFMALCCAAGLVAAALLVKKDSRLLFVILSFYVLFTIWLAPLFLWNFIYLIFIVRRKRKPPVPI